MNITEIKLEVYSDHGNRAACQFNITAELIPVSTDGNIVCAMNKTINDMLHMIT